MITVTPEARNRLSEALEHIDEQAPKGACFRIVLDPQNQLSLSVGVPDQEDATVEENGRTILAVPPDVAEVVEDRTLDVEEREPGAAVLTLR
jgi:hypothetical protein